MTKEISATGGPPEVITEEKIISYLDVMGIGSGLTPAEKTQFIEIATAFQLNPFKREIYCIPFIKNVKGENGQWTKERALSIITGYEVYLKRAERTEELDGWSIETQGKISAGSLKAIATIHRKDWTHPFIHTVYFREYNQDNKMWKSKPVTMLKKVAIAQAFRMAFPDEFSGMPYTSDEVSEEMGGGEFRDVTPAENGNETEMQQEPAGSDGPDPSEGTDPIFDDLAKILTDAARLQLITEAEKTQVLQNARKYTGAKLVDFTELIKSHIAELEKERQSA